MSDRCLHISDVRNRCEIGGTAIRFEYHSIGAPTGNFSIYYFTIDETERMANVAGNVGKMAQVLHSIDPSGAIMMFRLSAGLLSWKAKRCLKHGKALKIECYAWLPVPYEYDP